MSAINNITSYVHSMLHVHVWKRPLIMMSWVFYHQCSEGNIFENLNNKINYYNLKCYSLLKLTLFKKKNVFTIYFVAMASFCISCSALLNDDLIRRLLVTTEACLAMLPRFGLIFSFLFVAYYMYIAVAEKGHFQVLGSNFWLMTYNWWCVWGSHV